MHRVSDLTVPFASDNGRIEHDRRRTDRQNGSRLQFDVRRENSALQNHGIRRQDQRSNGNTLVVGETNSNGKCLSHQHI